SIGIRNLHLKPLPHTWRVSKTAREDDLDAASPGVGGANVTSCFGAEAVARSGSFPRIRPSRIRVKQYWYYGECYSQFCGGNLRFAGHRSPPPFIGRIHFSPNFNFVNPRGWKSFEENHEILSTFAVTLR